MAMWRRAYFLLLLVRIYFTLSPSYLHPDENFQGPEVITGQLFSYPVQTTWEWTSSHPIRSVFPLWPVYGIPLTLLKWIWTKDEQGHVSPEAIYYTLRVAMFILSLVLEDWAIYELVHSPRQRRQVVILVASSYVTWTYQSHTFSNSTETLLVAWSLVLIERVVRQKDRSSIRSCGVLSFIVVFGVFNRITFPAFLVIPGLQLLPHFRSRPASFLSMIGSALVLICVAIATDTAFYRGPEATNSLTALLQTLRTNPVITPWNNIRYNTQTSNLALHGLHPRHQHFLINLPQLLGPALILLTSLQVTSIHNLQLAFLNPPLLSAVSGTFLLSIFPHQEPRFLLPCVPLLLTCVRFPASTRGRKWFWTSWLTFNILLGTLMGVYHQGGVIPAQLRIPEQIKSFASSSSSSSISRETPSVTVFWWKTYPPPTYLLGKSAPLNISTVPLMGLPQPEMLSRLSSAFISTCNSTTTTTTTTTTTKKITITNTTTTTAAATNNDNRNKAEALETHNQIIYLVAPLSSSFFPPPPPSSPHTRTTPFSFTITTPTNRDTTSTSTTTTESPARLPPQDEDQTTEPSTLELTLEWSHARHINHDDIDVGEEGIWATLNRVVGRRGIGIWRVRRL